MNPILAWLKRVWKVLHAPYYRSAATLARVSVLLATVLWGAFVIYAEPNVERYPTYDLLRVWMPLRFWAWGAVYFAGAGLVRVLINPRFTVWGTIPYAGIAAFWTFLAYGLWTLPVIPPGGFSAITTVALLSLYAFIANPFDNEDNRADQHSD